MAARGGREEEGEAVAWRVEVPVVVGECARPCLIVHARVGAENFQRGIAQ
jgi:hypothetical protein